MKVDILPTKKHMRCKDCDDQWGTMFAINQGICVDPLCFSCITKYVNNQEE